MALLKFYGAKPFTKFLVESYENGAPANPAACSGVATIFTYNEEQKGRFKGVPQAFGTMIICDSAPAYALTVNAVLAGGGEVDVNSAVVIGSTTRCGITTGEGGVVNVSKTKVTDTKEEASTEEVDTQTESSTEGGDTETTSIEEVQPTLENEAPQMVSTTDGANDSEGKTSEVDWGFAESLIDTGTKPEAKAALAEYASQFGVSLDVNRKFEDMMVVFKGSLQV